MIQKTLRMLSYPKHDPGKHELLFFRQSTGELIDRHLGATDFQVTESAALKCLVYIPLAKQTKITSGNRILVILPSVVP